MKRQKKSATLICGHIAYSNFHFNKWWKFECFLWWAHACRSNKTSVKLQQPTNKIDRKWNKTTNKISFPSMNIWTKKATTQNINIYCNVTSFSYVRLFSCFILGDFRFYSMRVYICCGNFFHLLIRFYVKPQ